MLIHPLCCSADKSTAATFVSDLRDRAGPYLAALGSDEVSSLPPSLPLSFFLPLSLPHSLPFSLSLSLSLSLSFSLAPLEKVGLWLLYLVMLALTCGGLLAGRGVAARLPGRYCQVLPLNLLTSFDLS